MKVEFICGTLCMIAILLAVMLFTRKHENFATISYKVTEQTEPPNKENPNVRTSKTTLDICGNGIPVAITNLLELSGAMPSNLTGKSQHESVNAKPSKISTKANKFGEKQGAMAKLRRAVRKELEDKRKFQNTDEDVEDVEDVEDGEMLDTDMLDSGECNDMSKPNPRRRRSPALDQGDQFKGDSCSSCGVKHDKENACESSEYIKKDSIPCWGCTLPSGTD